jgi:hypothetical protein
VLFRSRKCFCSPPHPGRIQTPNKFLRNMNGVWFPPRSKRAEYSPAFSEKVEYSLELHHYKEAKAHCGLPFEFFAVCIHISHTHLKSLAVTCREQQIPQLLLSALVLGLVLINMHVFNVAVTVGMSTDTDLIYFAFRSTFR